jgi:hypothetical protein
MEIEFLWKISKKNTQILTIYRRTTYEDVAQWAL